VYIRPKVVGLFPGPCMHQTALLYTVKQIIYLSYLLLHTFNIDLLLFKCQLSRLANEIDFSSKVLS
jgi:hypothetical protein